jgi:hypothetical protein
LCRITGGYADRFEIIGGRLICLALIDIYLDHKIVIIVAPAIDDFLREYIICRARKNVHNIKIEAVLVLLYQLRIYHIATGAGMAKAHAFLCSCSILLSGCSALAAGLPRAATPGEQSSGYGYIPVDPLPISHRPCDLVSSRPATDFEPWPVLKALPDFAIRFAVADLKASAGPTFGPVKITMKGQSYRVIMDYINADAVPVTLLLTRLESDGISGAPQRNAPSREIAPGRKVVGYIAELAPADPVSTLRSEAGPKLQALTRVPRLDEDDPNVERYTFPVYVGVGLRLSADVEARSAGVNLSGLSSIGLAAEAGKVAGTLTIQTLGVNGKSIAIALPLPSKLDQTTVENGILSMGGMRALLYAAAASDTDSVNIQPRVVGIYSPVGSDPRLINAVYSLLARNPPVWVDRCSLKANASAAPAAPKPTGADTRNRPTKATTAPAKAEPAAPAADLTAAPAAELTPSISSTIQPPPPPPAPD